jgi:starch synthase
MPSQDIDMPVAGMVSRLASQKGLDILCESLEEMFKLDVYLVILGTGDEKIQNILRSTKGKYPTHLGLEIAFDDTAAHKIISGSDLLLIPSRYEPCGLTQMYSLKYGTIPVVRATGGLDDSIQEFDGNKLEGNGFKFEDYSADALLNALKKACFLYHQKEKWQKLIQNAMSCDFSWDKAATEYLSLYKKIISISKNLNSKFSE